MPYKVYTYTDPYKIGQTDFWNEIASLPHFCAARTLVNGLKDVMQDDIHGLICQLDDFVKHESVYKKWVDNVALQVHQYSALTAHFTKALEEGRIEQSFYNSLIQNQNHFLEALRLFIELDIPAAAIDKEKGNKEQKFFVETLEKYHSSKLFEFPATPNKNVLHQVMIDLAEKELTDYQSRNKKPYSKDIVWYEHAIEVTKRNSIDSIVVHGLHQFSPAQLRLLIDMEKMGFTIIFLFNYQEQYADMYSSWMDIYQCFDAKEIHHDQKIRTYCPEILQNQSNALAMALGMLNEGTGTSNKAVLKNLYKNYKSVPYYEFANITEYAHYVSEHVDEATRKAHDLQSVIERGNGEPNNREVLRVLDEQVYTANRDIHTLLKIYYPRFSNNRHFLAYPIGQFFSAIYRLWDYENNAIKMDIPAIKECLSSNILTSGKAEDLLKTFTNVEILFDGLQTYKEFEKVVAEDYLRNYKEINARGINSPLRKLSIYNPYRVTEADINSLVKAINEVNQIANRLFSIDNTHENYINFGRHFQNLEDFLKQRDLSMVTQEERELLNALQLRLNTIQPEKSSFSGTFRDLQEGIYYYLKQKEDDNGVDWLVKNFEQIDGDILQTKRQFQNGDRKTYHFACLSDYDLNCHMDDLLPWPLTDSFIRKAYSPIDLQFQVYYSALGERSNFLKYALFYGLFFNYCDVKLSYVKEYGDEVTEPYAPLRILGIKIDTYPLKADDSSLRMTHGMVKQTITKQKYEKLHMMDMFLCPYRYFLDYVVEDEPVIQGSFLYQKFYENLLVEAVWKNIAGKPKNIIQAQLQDLIRREAAKYRKCFSFWKDSEIFDLNNRVKNYLSHYVIENSPYRINSFNKDHMNIRELFGLAKFDIDISDREPKNPYAKFELLADVDYPTKTYSLHKVETQTASRRAEDYYSAMMEYLNQDLTEDKTAITSDWCTYCTHKGNCMEPFLKNR